MNRAARTWGVAALQGCVLFLVGYVVLTFLALALAGCGSSTPTRPERPDDLRLDPPGVEVVEAQS